MTQPGQQLVKRALLFACMLLTINLIAIAQGPGRNSFLEAENLRRQNKFREAIQQYEVAIRLEPTNYKYYFQKGKCEYQIKDVDNAKESFRRTVEFQHNFTPAYSLLGKIYKDENDFQNAIFYFEEAAKYESDPERKIQYKLLLINLLLKENRMSEARRHIAEARSIDPTNPNILYYDAELNVLDSNWEQARQNYEKALASPKLAGAPPAELAKYYYGLGLAYFNLGDVVSAKRVWSKANFGPYAELIAQQLQQSDYTYFYKVAVSYYLNGEYDASERFINRALEVQKIFPSAYLLKGRIANQQGSTAQAIQYYQEAADQEREPEKKAKAFYYIASLHMSQRNYRGALEALDQVFALSKQPTSGMIYMQAKANYAQGRYEEVVQKLDELSRVTTDPNSKAKYQFLSGMAAKKSGNTDKAIESFKAAMYGAVKPAAKEELNQLTGEK